jgi:hypothetical protein
VRWDEWYSKESICPSFRALRRAKLARVVRCYADKARRHYLAKERYEHFIAEIDRMIEKGKEYAFAEADKADRGWVFCPEYAGSIPLEISPPGWQTRIFLVGPGLLPDLDFRRETPVAPATVGRSSEAISARSLAEEFEHPTGHLESQQQLESSVSKPTASQLMLSQARNPMDATKEGSWGNP